MMREATAESVDEPMAAVREPQFGDYVLLLKPRVMSLVVFTAAVGLIVAPGAMHPVLAFAAILFIALGAGASGALNMWWDADIDRHMRRTRGRPVPAGRIAPEAARDLGLGLSAISVAMLGLIANWAAAALLAFTIFFYVVIYTIWLKRRTPQNIVIGGAAGAFPPMIGWLAATGSLDWPALLMFALIFMWTPPHFWALALFVRDDYSNAGVPMLTVTHGRDHARRAILIYTVLLVPVSLALVFSSVGGPVTAAAAVLLDLAFLRGAWRIARRDDAQSAADHHAAERAFFKLSLLYLFLHFAALLADSALAGLGLAPAGWPRIL